MKRSRKRVLPQDRQTKTVSEVIDWFIAHAITMTSTEAKVECVRVMRLFSQHVNEDGRKLGGMLVTDCIGADLLEFLNAYQRGASQWTRLRWCSTIKRPFNEAVRYGLIAANPFRAVRERKGGRGREVTWDDFRKMFRIAPPHMRRVLLFLRFSGARPGELRNMEWKDIDFDGKQVTLWEHKADGDGSPRVIPLNGHCMRLLLWLWRQRTEEGKAALIARLRQQIRRHATTNKRGAVSRRIKVLFHRRKVAAESTFVFTNAYEGSWTKSAICHAFRRLRRKVGLPLSVKLHGNRHSFITEALLSGVDLATVAELVGHRRIATTMVYAHLASKKPHLNGAANQAVHFGGTPSPKPAPAPSPSQPAPPAPPVSAPSGMIDVQALVSLLRQLLPGQQIQSPPTLPEDNHAASPELPHRGGLPFLHLPDDAPGPLRR